MFGALNWTHLAPNFDVCGRVKGRSFAQTDLHVAILPSENPLGERFTGSTLELGSTDDKAV